MPERPRHLLRRIPRALFLLLASLLVGLAANLAVTALIVENTDFLATAASANLALPAQQDAREGDHLWSVVVTRRFGALEVQSHHKIGGPWSPHQAAGPPDAALGTDSVNAWASQAQDAAAEWLELFYADPVTPVKVEIHETYAPGAVAKITAFDDAGREHVAWEGKAYPAGVAHRINVVPVQVPFPTKRLKLYIDSAAVPNWNEVDAVALVDAAGVRRWATGAKASSYYGAPAPAAPGAAATHALLADAVPPLGFLATPSAAVKTGQAKEEHRVVRAYGWPALTMTREHPPVTINALQGQAPKTRYHWAPAGPATPQPTPPDDGSPPPIPPVEVRPIWRGFAINTATYAGLALLGFLALIAPLRLTRQLTRMRDGCCIECGYQLGYDFKSGCPNCGWRRTSEFPPPVQ